ncbi:hypothetical protein Q5H92_22885 [Hymenobacter sp. M29]|uniref:Helix-turn-helix type 11 domain-containing protein n=1 Tax=Hymenobacter mellowenesis TaxID=3063995 RepID=A0ABT9AI32_9BACT|nr:hypothetical protein [Hymenobacter sp. M29]MDO7849228.1 hypothetical protein [Hymenobacter sp. M29]
MASKDQSVMARVQAIVPTELTTSFDRIYYSYLSEEVEALLTEEELERRARIDDAWHYMVKRKSPLAAAQWLQEKLDVSRATAYRIVREALQVFGDVVKTSKDAKRRLLWEYSLKGLDKCLKIDDMRAYAAILKNMTTFEGLNLEDNTFDGEAIQAHTYIIQVGRADGGELRFNANAIEELPETEYTEVLEAVENMTTSVAEMEELLDRAAQKGKKKS